MTEIEDIFFNQLTMRCDKWYPYFSAYEKHAKKFRGKECKFLEIGVQLGGSLEMWKKYLGDKSQIYGVDIDKNILDLNFKFDANLEVGDQENPEFWKEYTSKHGMFDIIVDDGGHTMAQQQNSLLSLFKKLKYGGIYIIEDTHTSYWENYGGGFRNPNSFVEVTKNLIDLLHARHIEKEKPSRFLTNSFHGLESISFYDSIIVLEKEIPKDFKNVTNMDWGAATE